jgi:Domain of unknown function (DUF4349)
VHPRATNLLALAAAVIAVVVVPAGCSSGDDDGAEGGGAQAPTVEERAGGGEHGASEGAPDGAGLVTSRLGSLGPRIVQTAGLTLSVPTDGLEDAVARARTVAVGLGGFVVSSSVRDVRRKAPTKGSLVVRIPMRNYARAIASFVEIGRVQAREESGEDVSQEFVDLEARTRHLGAVERQLLELLQRARTVSAALAVQSQLNATQLELEQVRGRLRFLDDQTAFATISLSIRERVVAPGSQDGWGIIEAWRDGARAFTNVAGKIFVVAAGAAPLLILLVLGAVALRPVRRRFPPPWGVSRP